MATARTGDVVRDEAASTAAKAMLFGFIPVPKCPFPLCDAWYPDRQLDLLQGIPHNLHGRVRQLQGKYRFDCVGSRLGQNRDADGLSVRDEIK